MCHPGCNAKWAKKPTSCPANALAEESPIRTAKAPLCRVTAWGVTFHCSEFMQRHRGSAHPMLVVRHEVFLHYDAVRSPRGTPQDAARRTLSGQEPC